MSQCCALKPFVTRRCGHFYPVFFSLSSWRAGTHLLYSCTPLVPLVLPEQQNPAQSSCPGCLWARERGRHLQAEFNPAVLKWDDLSSGFFFFFLYWLSHRPASDFKNIEGRGGERRKEVRQKLSLGSGSDNSPRAETAWAQRSFLCWKEYAS